MRISTLAARFGAGCAAALLALAAPADATVYNFSLTGQIADGTYSSGGGNSFYNLDFAAPATPIELQNGDVFNIDITLDGFLSVPGASGFALLGVNILTRDVLDPDQNGFPGAGASDGTITLVDGSLAGSSQSSGCANCLAAIYGVGPNAPFTVRTTSSTITIGTLVSADPSDTSPFSVRGFSIGYQATDGAGPVPEPASWALMLTGFGAIGTALRRRPVPAAA